MIEKDQTVLLIANHNNALILKKRSIHTWHPQTLYVTHHGSETCVFRVTIHLPVKMRFLNFLQTTKDIRSNQIHT